MSVKCSEQSLGYNSGCIRKAGILHYVDNKSMERLSWRQSKRETPVSLLSGVLS